MEYSIDVIRNTALSSISSWNPNDNSIVVFKLYSDTSFQIFAESAAIGKLRDLQKSGFEIKVEIHNSILDDGKRVKDDSFPNILNSIFGLELLHVAREIVSPDPGSGAELRNMLGNHIWNNVKTSRGVIQSGKTVYFLSRHGYEVPVILRDVSSIISFPSFSFFRETISKYLTGFRFGTGVTESENDLFEWLFHAFENVFDHACVEYSDKIKKDLPIDGYRGILLQKIKLTSKNDFSRNDFPVIVQNFIEQRINDGEIGDDLIVNVMTVMDIGSGIHKTISIDENLTEIEQLTYAFKDGVSRKRLNSRERAGYGLGAATEAAKQLNALFYITSSNKTMFYDFSDDPVKQIPSKGIVFNEYNDVEKTSGSSLSVIWAHQPEKADQLDLKI